MLFELLTGRQAFRGETVTDILAAILEREPDWNALPGGTPQAARRVLERCLQKDADRRFHDIADVRIFLEDASGGEATGRTGGVTGGIVVGEAAAPEAGARRRVPAAVHVGWAVAALALAALAYVGGSRGTSPEGGETYPAAALAVTLPAGAEQHNVWSPPAISPDGTKLAFVVEEEEETQIYMRHLDRLEPVLQPGTEGAADPFFSPDGNHLAFFADDKLQVLSLEGGTPHAVAPATNPRGGTWGEDGWIYFAPEISMGIRRVTDAGGEVEAVTEPDSPAGERSHRLPELLPGGRGLLLTVGTSRITSFDDAHVDLVSLPSGERRTLIEDAAHARYVSTGHIVYTRAGTLLAVPFALDRMELAGPPQVVLDGIVHDPLRGVVNISVSRSGSLAYLAGGPADPGKNLAFLDREGNATLLTERRLPYMSVAASPDGRYLAMGIDGANSNVWIHDLERDILSRLTMEWSNFLPTWTPDGAEVTFMSGRTGEGTGIFSRRADGSGDPVELVPPGQLQTPTSWSPDGRFLLFDAKQPDQNDDIWVLNREDGSVRPFLETPFTERGGSFSPDGRWVAYESDEAGDWEVYVRPFPGPGRKWPISSGGGEGARWSLEGSELFYRDGDGRLVAMPVETGAEFRPGRPVTLFVRDDVVWGDIMPDGERLVAVLEPEDKSPSAELRVILGWARDLPRLAPHSP